MKQKYLFVAVLAVLGGAAHAASDFVDSAPVISSKPRIERVTESRQECDPVQPAPKKETSIVAPILGGVAGGLLGHQVGQGSGKTAATIIGATGGAVAGSVIANNSGSSTPPPQQCRTIETSREVVNGYDVVYRYNGRDVNVVMPSNPGSTIKVGVSAIVDDRPAETERRAVDNNAPRGRDGRDGRDGRSRRDRDGGYGRQPGAAGDASGGNYQYRY